MAGLHIDICFWYLDHATVEEILQLLRQGNYDPHYEVYKERAKLEKKLREGSADLVISDFDLPGNLRNTVEELAGQYVEKIPMIYLVGEKNEVRAAETLKSGVWDYILKSHMLKLVPTIYSSQKYRKVLYKSRRVEEERLLQDELSNVLVAHISDPIVIMNEDWDILFANNRAADRLDHRNRNKEQIIAYLQEILVDQHGKPHREVFRILRSRKIRKDQRFYAGFIRDDGSTVYGFLDFKRVKSEELGQWLIIITFRDMTELRKAEQELVETEDRYLSIFNSIHDGLILLEKEKMGVLDYNPKITEMFGIGKQKSHRILDIEQLSAVDHGFNRDRFKQHYDAVKPRKPVTFEWLCRNREGIAFWTQCTLSHVSIGKREQMMLVVRDIDKRKRIEASLLESQEHFRALAENSPDVIMRFDRNYRHLYVNSTVESQLGLKVDMFLNKSHEEMGIFPEEKCRTWESAIKQVFDSGKPHTIVFDIDVGKKKIFYEWRLFPERSDAGFIITILTIARDITSSRLAEMAIQESEERLQLALHATSMGLWDWNVRTGDVYYSTIYFTMLGYTPDAFDHTLETWHNLMHPEDREQTIKTVEESIRHKHRSFEIDFRMQRKDGSYAWVRGRGRAVQWDEHGNTIRLTGTHEDISERKRGQMIQQALFDISNAVNTTRNLDELYEKIRESLGTIVDTRNCFLALYNKDNNTLSMPFHRDELDTFAEFPAGKTLTGYVVKTGKSQLVDREREKELTRQGEIEPVGSPCVSWLGVPLKRDDHIIGVFVVQSYTDEVVYDESDMGILEFASDQIALAIERKRDQDNIFENQEKQRRIFEASPDPMLVVDPEGKVTDYNTSFLKTFHITSERVVGQNIFHFIEKSFWRRAILNFRETWEEGFLKNLEYKVIRADGTFFEGEVSTGAMFDGDGKPESMVILLKNIDERKEGERRLREAKEKAEESDRLKTAFLSNMSHEIRTPMNAIIGFSDLLNDPEITDEEKKEFIAQINFGADNLMHLIDDIIDISKIEAGQISINKTDFNLHQMAGELLMMFQQNLSRLDKEHIEMRLNWLWPEKELTLHSDPHRLKQILGNLLGNAIKFTDEGFVELGVERSYDQLRIYVRDSGIGIKAEKQKVIFDRFRQGYDAGKKLYGGTGLGLAISRNLALLLGGEIGVNSTPGVGSEFWLIIPNHTGKASSIHDKKVDPEQKINWKGKTILVAEDDYSNYQLILNALKDTRAELIWAKDGEETLSLFEKHKKELNLVLMDIRMPRTDGYACTREIKKQKPRLPILAQTAYAMSGEMQLSKEAGCDDYIAKPLQIKDLIRKIDALIR